jgi:hypothetical protein
MNKSKVERALAGRKEWKHPLPLLKQGMIETEEERDPFCLLFYSSWM